MSRLVLEITQITPEDYEPLKVFLSENDQASITHYFHPFRLDADTAHLIARTAHLDRYYVARVTGNIVGFCMLRGWDKGYVIPSFGAFVDYRHHGQGIGRALTEFSIAEATRLGCTKMRLSVYASNVRALALYRALGFEEIDRKSCLLDGLPDENIIMMKDLSG